jgi:hypothetical protein
MFFNIFKRQPVKRVTAEELDKIVKNKIRITIENEQRLIEDTVNEIYELIAADKFTIDLDTTYVTVKIKPISATKFFSLAARLLQDRYHLINLNHGRYINKSEYVELTIRPLTNDIQINEALNNLNMKALANNLHIYERKDSNPKVYFVDKTNS